MITGVPVFNQLQGLGEVGEVGQVGGEKRKSLAHIYTSGESMVLFIGLLMCVCVCLCTLCGKPLRRDKWQGIPL